jgi:purine-binding chemotaxis protein CheW
MGGKRPKPLREADMNTMSAPTTEIRGGMPPAAPGAARGPGKHLIFSLGKEEFAVPVAKVKEIIGMLEVTPVPHTAEYVRGVINLRGKVVPVIDLRLKLGVPSVEYDERTCIVVVQPEMAKSVYLIGVIVDGVSEVMPVQSSEIEKTETFSHGLISSGYVQGVAKIRGKVKILLDLDCVLSQSDLQQLL